VAAPFINKGARPRVAILREQGVNSHLETAYAFDRAGFDAYDVHMSDLLAGRATLADFAGAVACGGFSYGDVLGAGEGWAKTIRFNAQLADNRQAVREAQQRYQRGQEGLLPVLEDQEQLYTTQDAQVTSTLTRCLADISLFKALGGNWEEVALPNVVADRSAISRK